MARTPLARDDRNGRQRRICPKNERCRGPWGFILLSGEPDISQRPTIAHRIYYRKPRRESRLRGDRQKPPDCFRFAGATSAGARGPRTGLLEDTRDRNPLSAAVRRG